MSSKWDLRFNINLMYFTMGHNYLVSFPSSSTSLFPDKHRKQTNIANINRNRNSLALILDKNPPPLSIEYIFGSLTRRGKLFQISASITYVSCYGSHFLPLVQSGWGRGGIMGLRERLGIQRMKFDLQY